MVIGPGRIAAALTLVAGILTPGAPAQAAAAPPALYPPTGRITQFLDHRALLGDTPEPDWYEANIPFVDLPDDEIEKTYYYRWRTFKEALKYTGPKDGWIVSEFLGPVGYSAPFGGIDAAAGHHIYEGRWLRDRRYLDDYLDYWLTGSGSEAKPATEDLNKNTTDWAHQYSFWAVDAAVARAEVTGDWKFLTDRMPALEKQYQGWKKTNFDASRGVYWQTPVWDAMEFTASSYQSDDPYHGGDGYRPTLNAYQYGDARALALLKRRTGDARAARRYENEAAQLKAATDRVMWDGSFYKHVMKGQDTRIADREQIGFIPWYFNMPSPAKSSAWEQLTDPQGFAAPYGPTTTERRSPWFMHEALNGCCRWDGPSWPFATSQTLTALANQLLDYPAQSYVDKDDYTAILRGYALTQRKNGRPYVAEAHHPDEDRWIYDGSGHSEDYNHSTFTDLVLSGLLGIRPQADDTVRIAPLVPSTWNHFAVENVPYHGHNLTVLWDRDGSVYGRGAGLRVWVDGVPRIARSTVGDVRVAVGAAVAAAGQPELVDDAANVRESGYPRASASYTWSADSAANAIDGQDFHLDVPTTRWTTWQSPNAQDWLAVDLGAPTAVSDVRLDFYDDGGGVRTPDAYALQYQNAAGDWADVPGQQRTPAAPAGRAINRIVVDPPLTTDRIRVVPTRTGGGAVGLTALQVWRPADPRLDASFTVASLDVDAGSSVVVRTRIKATTTTPDVRASLEVPRGWTARARTASRAPVLRAGATLTTTWDVTVPASADPLAGLPVRVLARSGAGPRISGAVLPTSYQFDPADYPATLWDDDFTTDRLASYRVDHPAAEPSPALSVSGGTVTATAGSRAFAVLAAPVTAAATGTAVIVEPSSFAGSSPEDSLFLGLSTNDGTNALAWYNNFHRTSGADVRVDGNGQPNGGCCANVQWQAGDRFAVLARSGTLTTWHQRGGGAWTLIHTAPLASVAGNPAFGLRLDSGALAVTRFTVLAR
ncbi:discoidin domain-containing protein [Actinoplanes bogorensis]|uniref:Discoidin domain-containing protein n=1 Tax=Paractinoplanes bogorensis TaxID=1610840 RepID=A0ABS5YVY1_9ACTN|nr:discoidin domain-containing protein [Actinoplanes bogorensis]MBU2666874.1 discoidin domain-containing protein [Actinoplanes bogorensis]